MTTPVQICFCLDEGFLQPTLVALYSTLRNTNHDIRVHIMGYELSATSWQKIKQLTARFPHAALVQHALGKSDFILPEHKVKHISGASFLRLKTPDYISGRCIYLDGDILVQGDIAPFYHFDIQDKIVGVIRSTYFVDIAYHLDELRSKSALSTDETAYLARKTDEVNVSLEQTELTDIREFFNAGILLIDYDRLADNPALLAEFQSMEGAQTRGKGRDQPWLNYVFRGKTAFVPTRYNVQTMNSKPAPDYLSEHAAADWNDARENAAIIHFLGKKKPWHPLKSCITLRTAKWVLNYRKEMWLTKHALK